MSDSIEVEYDVLEKRESDGRAVVLVVRSPTGPALLKSVAVADPQSFEAKIAGLAVVRHESLVRIRTAGLGRVEGTASVMVDLPDAPTLEKADDISPSSIVQLGTEIGRALFTLHKAGKLAGKFTAADIYMTAPAMLDVSLAPLTEDSTTAAEVENLIKILIARAPYHNDLRARLDGVTDAELLVKRLDSIHVNTRTVIDAAAVPEELRAGDRLVGKMLDQWTLEKLVGEGTTAWVYRAREMGTGRIYAIKILKAKHGISNDEYLRRARNEVKAVERVDNEHIVKLNSVGLAAVIPNANPLVYFCMPYLDGTSLAERMLREAISVDGAASICSQVARALAEAHSEDVVHRDVKPANIFLIERSGTKEYVKVLDFGLANMRDKGPVDGVVVGSPAYMAPEQALGRPFDPRCDLYSLGIVLYEILAGRKPFEADSFEQLVPLITTSEPPPLPEFSRGGEFIPPRLAKLVVKAIAKNPEDRIQSGGEFADELDTFVTRVIDWRFRSGGRLVKSRDTVVTRPIVDGEIHMAVDVKNDVTDIETEYRRRLKIDPESGRSGFPERDGILQRDSESFTYFLGAINFTEVPGGARVTHEIVLEWHYEVYLRPTEAGFVLCIWYSFDNSHLRPGEGGNEYKCLLPLPGRFHEQSARDTVKRERRWMARAIKEYSTKTNILGEPEPIPELTQESARKIIAMLVERNQMLET